MKTMTIGERLKALRKERHCTLEDVARSLNISRANINKYESGIITNIPSDRIEQLARFYSVSPAYIMGWEENNKYYMDLQLFSEQEKLPHTNEARIISEGIDRLPKKRREQAMKLMQIVFPEYFEDDSK